VNERLRTYLDPNTTGTLVLNGSADPCSVAAVPVANFIGNPTTVTSGGTVAFTDQSSGNPTSWAWTITPGIAGTAWSYTGGTNASSQNPQVIFTTVGMYTITLVATNGLGSDSEVKTNYINVTAGGGSGVYCAASGTSSCGSANGEYISSVQLGAFISPSACSNYSNFTPLGPTLAQGSANTVTVQAQITGGLAGSAYIGDEIAVWIDFNADGTFSMAERVGYFLVGTTVGQPSFNFTVPANAVIGNTRMRVRISYQPEDGNINPCNTTIWGEVEDYRITITVAGSGSNVGISENLTDGILIYPNPVNDQLTIDLSSSNTEATISLYDVSGKLIAKKSGDKSGQTIFDISHVEKGIYQVVISTPDATIVRRISKI
jgi:PKD repeat protein